VRTLLGRVLHDVARSLLEARRSRTIDDLVDRARCFLLWHPVRPIVQLGDVVEVLYHDPEPRWVPHVFEEWADSPVVCRSCGSLRPNPRMLVRQRFEGVRIVVAYDGLNLIGARLPIARLGRFGRESRGRKS
jgi:hypothetical protein